MPAPSPIPAWFWPWARWYLGRNEFKGHARDPRLRPKEAPARIPAWAWARGAAAGWWPTHGSSVRDSIVKWARWGVANEPSIHYSMGSNRDDWLSKPPGTLPLYTDCSGFATACYAWAGHPIPPEGWVGYTGTMLMYGRRVDSCKPGDLIVYGPGTGHHVVVAVEAGTDPLCVSHGQEKGPFLIRHSEEARYQPPGVTFLRFLDD